MKNNNNELTEKRLLGSPKKIYQSNPRAEAIKDIKIRV
jgi:hypothetical protein